jgi:hypothetical protein
MYVYVYVYILINKYLYSRSIFVKSNYHYYTSYLAFTQKKYVYIHTYTKLNNIHIQTHVYHLPEFLRSSHKEEFPQPVTKTFPPYRFHVELVILRGDLCFLKGNVCMNIIYTYNYACIHIHAFLYVNKS